MSDLKPIFPPEGPVIFSADHVEASIGLVGEEQRKILEADRASLTSITIMGALALGEQIQLSQGARYELAEAIAERAGQLPHEYHTFVNELLGNVVGVFDGQMKTKAEPIEATSTTTTKPPDKTSTPQSTAPVSSAHVGSPPSVRAEVSRTPTTTAPSPARSPLYNDRVPPQPARAPITDWKAPTQPDLAANKASSPAVEVNSEEHSSADIIKLDENNRLYKHPNLKSLRAIDTLLERAMPGGLSSEVFNLSEAERCLVAHQLIELSSSPDAPHLAASSTKLSRFIKHLGLYAPPVKAEPLATETNTTVGNIYTQMSDMRDYIQRMPKDADLLIRRAKETANLVSTEDIFWNENEQANDPANVERPFAEHTITPANMKTFLRASFLEDYFSGAPLKPWQASILVRDIIDTIQKFGNLKPEVFAERAKWVERYTGLYGNEKTYQELANSAGLSTDGVIRKAITKMSSDFLSKVTDSEKTRLYNKASVAPRPDNLVVPT